MAAVVANLSYRNLGNAVYVFPVASKRRYMASRTPPESDPERTDLSLLGKTQSYLRAILEARVPDSLLTAAWEEFYRRYDEIIRRFVRASGIPASDVEDCVQEVWMAVCKYLADFRHPVQRPGLRAWLYQLVHSKAVDVLRSQRRKSRTTTLSEEVVDERTSRSVWDAIFIRLIYEEVTMGQPELRRKVFQMRFVEGLPTGEVSNQLGVNPNVVRYHFRRMLHILRQHAAVFAGSAVVVDVAGRRE